MGCVYILVNECMPGLIKIGVSRHDATVRARTLYSTGVALPFKVAYQLPIYDPYIVERAVHCALHRFRVNQSREFFRCTVEQAIEVVEIIACEFHSKSPYQYQFMDLENVLMDDIGMEVW